MDLHDTFSGMSDLLTGVKAYVDVRSSDGKANYSMCVREQLQLLGADVHTQLTALCTHVVGTQNLRSYVQCIPGYSGAAIMNICNSNTGS